jgi:hypothetical protein
VAPRDHDSVNDSSEEPWSPARAPYAIAVSQSWWAFHAAVLFATDATHSSGPAQQIYARQIFRQLSALRRCAEMQARELKRLGIGEAQRTRLDREIASFDKAVPAAKPGRDLLEHFDEYARGEGRLQREAIRDQDIDVHEAAAKYWGGGYDLATEQLTEGPFTLVVPNALEPAEQLRQAIYAAGHSSANRFVAPTGYCVAYAARRGRVDSGRCGLPCGAG